GAERTTYATLARQGDGWLLTAGALPEAQAGKLHVKLSSQERVVREGALALARLAAGAGVSIEAGRASTPSNAAITAYARCYATLVEQPLVINAPVVLDQAKLKQAIESCRAATAADSQFQDAAAALGLALALAGQDADAIQTLARVKEGDGYLPFY